MWMKTDRENKTKQKQKKKERSTMVLQRILRFCFFICSHSLHLDIHSRWELYVSPTSIYVVTLFALVCVVPYYDFNKRIWNMAIFSSSIRYRYLSTNESISFEYISEKRLAHAKFRQKLMDLRLLHWVIEWCKIEFRERSNEFSGNSPKHLGQRPILTAFSSLWK